MIDKLNYSDLTTEQMKQLNIMDDDIIQKIVQERLRGVSEQISKQQIVSAWMRIALSAKNVLNVDLESPSDADDIKNEIIRIVANKLR